MKKNIAILTSMIAIAFVVNSCSTEKCYKCELYYVAGIYYNPSTHDSIGIRTTSSSFGLDTIQKYYSLGYLSTGYGSIDHVDQTLCDEELKKLNKKGINYKCSF